MSLRKKIYSGILLALYLMLIVAHSVHHDSLHHQHNSHETAHHVHHFHVGIIHFLGHLIHNIQEVHDSASEHQYYFDRTTRNNNHNSPVADQDLSFLAAPQVEFAELSSWTVCQDRRILAADHLSCQRWSPLRAPPVS